MVACEQGTFDCKTMRLRSVIRCTPLSVIPISKAGFYALLTRSPFIGIATLSRSTACLITRQRSF